MKDFLEFLEKHQLQIQNNQQMMFHILPFIYFIQLFRPTSSRPLQDTNYLTSIQHWWGHNGQLSISFIRPDELIQMSKESLQAKTDAEKKEWAGKIVKFIGDEALVVPIVNSPSGFLHDGTVHTSYPIKGSRAGKCTKCGLNRNKYSQKQAALPAESAASFLIPFQQRPVILN